MGICFARAYCPKPQSGYGMPLFVLMKNLPYWWLMATAAFKCYIEQGQGGWVGLNHASLLGESDSYPMWPWFSDFRGKPVT